MKRKIVKEEEILRKANSKGRKILRRGKLREEKCENTQGGKMGKYSARKNGKILSEEKYSGMRGGNTQGGEEEEGGATGERERVTISRCQPAHLHL